MSSPYRIKWPAVTNVPGEVVIEGVFTLGANGAPTTIRPSAGTASGANGNLFTVTQLGTAFGATNANCYQVTFTEQYLQSVSKHVEYHPVFATTFTTPTLYQAQSTTYDPTTNSFVILVFTEGTVGGAATAPALTSSLAAGSIYFRAVFKNTVSPASN